MLLKTFQVKGFKCLRETNHIRFFDDLTVFTGENDSGKSSCIKALELFLNPKGIPEQKHFYYIPVEKKTNDEETEPTKPEQVNEIQLIGTFELSLHEQELWETYFPFSGNCQLVEIQRTFVTGGKPAPYISPINVPNDDQLTNVRNLKVGELNDVAKRYGIDFDGARLKSEKVEKIEVWLADNEVETKELGTQLPSEIVEKLPSIEIFSSESAENPEQTIHSMLKGEFRTLIRSKDFAGRLGTIERDINSELLSHADRYVDAIKKYIQDLDEVEVVPSFDFSGGLSSTELQLHRHGRQVSLQNSGAGQRRRITLAVYEARLDQLKNQEDEDSDDSPNLIMAFDEPDTHLDYNWQRRIFDTITAFGALESVQVLSSTHSLNFIERVPIQKIVHFSLGEQRVTKCESFQFDSASEETEYDLENIFRYEISEQMGLRNSILLHERCFLIVEGETEMKALPVLFHLAYGVSLQAAGICLLNGENNSGVIQVIKFLREHGRNALFLIDTDSALNTITEEKLKGKLKIDQQHIHYAGVKEFEDLFEDSLWVEVMNELYPYTTSWCASDMQDCRNHPKEAFSKRLGGLVRNRLEYGIRKPDMGYALAQKIKDKTQIPETILKCFESAQEIANPN